MFQKRLHVIVLEKFASTVMSVDIVLHVVEKKIMDNAGF